MLILLVGEIGSGKSTVDRILYRYGFLSKSFADPIKTFAMSLGFDTCNIHGSQEDKLIVNEFWGVSGREFMQKFGTEIGRNLIPSYINLKLNGQTIWVRAMEKWIIEHDENDDLLITDGRFPDEARLVRDYGGIIIKLERNYQSDEKIASHVSETSINKIIPDYVVDNNGDLDQLEDSLINILNRHGKNLPNVAKQISDALYNRRMILLYFTLFFILLWFVLIVLHQY